MTTTTADLEPIHVPVGTWLLAAFAAFVVYALTLENGAILAGAAEYLHEFVHDGRHFMAVPCH